MQCILLDINDCHAYLLTIERVNIGSEVASS